jgi:hypothetical protein
VNQARQTTDCKYTLPAKARVVMLVCGLAVSLLSFLMAGGLVQAAPVIGSASTVVRDVKGQLERDWRVVVIHDNVHQDEMIKTGAASAARLVFADRTDFMIGAESEVVLDKFVYDSTSNSGQLILRATKGLMKFRTGSMSSRSYRIDTPVATVGVRGTEFVIQVFEGGGSYIKVISGEVVVTDHRNRSLTVKPGETAIVFPESDARAAAGPSLISERDFVLSDQTREMISQIVFSESNTQTQLTTQGQRAASVLVSGNAIQLNGIANGGNSPIAINPVEPTPQVKTGASGPLQSVIPSPQVSVPRGLPGSFFNSGFDSGLSGWTFRGRGSADVIRDPVDPLNQVLRLTTGSPVSLEQVFEPLKEPFTIKFLRRFLSDMGQLCAYIEPVDGSENEPDDADLTSDPICGSDALAVFTSNGAENALTEVSFDVLDEALYGLDELLLRLVFNAENGGVQVLLDDLTIVPYVEDETGSTEISLPPSVAFMAGVLAVAGLAARRRRRRSVRS